MLSQRDYNINIFLVKYPKLFKNCKFSFKDSLNLLLLFVGSSGRFVAILIGFKVYGRFGEIYNNLVSLGTANIEYIFNKSV